MVTPAQCLLIPDVQESKQKHYFCNPIVEWKMTRYMWTGCTDVDMRNSIMEHASELIIQLIRKQGLYNIYRGHDPSSLNELIHVAYMQIERTLYKYRSRPACRHCFSYDRPNASVLYEPSQFEFGIITPERLIQLCPKCPHCNKTLTVGSYIEPQQGLYGGTYDILYRGTSKVFNMWCIAPDSLLISCDGITTIQHVVDNNITSVESPDGQVPINGCLEKPEQDVIKVVLEKDYRITASHEHKFWTLLEDGPAWVQLGNLRIGDLLAVQCGQNYFANDDSIADCQLNKRGTWNPPPVINEELAYIIGVFIAKGSYSYNKLVMYNIDQEMIDRLVANQLGLNFIHEPQFQRISLCNVRFIEFLRWLGFPEYTEANTKHIPSKMLACSKEIICSMLRGMFDGDGHSRRSDGNVGYTSCSRILLNQLRMVLLNLGMLSKEYEDKRKSKIFDDYTSDLQPSWQLELPTESSTIFYDVVGFGLTRKNANRTFLKNSTEALHGVAARFHQLYQKYGAGTLGYNYCRTVITKKCRSLKVAIDKLRSWDNYSDDADYKFIADRISEANGVKRTVWLPIKQLVATRSRLCEISVDTNEHSYIANGFISHNSQVARTVILAYVKKDTRDVRNGDNYTEYITRKQCSGNNEQYVHALNQAKREMWFNHDYCRVIDALILLSSEVDPDKNFKKKLCTMADVDRRTADHALIVLQVMLDVYAENFSANELRCS